MDGYVTIGTKFDTKDFDAKYEKLEREVNKREVNVQIKTEKAEQTRHEIEAVNRELEETYKEMEKIAEDAERFAYLESKGLSNLTQDENFEYVALTMQNVDKEEKKLVDRIGDLSAQQSKLNTKLQEQNQAIDEANFKYREATQKFSEYKEQVNKTDFSNVKKSLNDIGNSISNVIQKVGKWALAVFSIRSAYMLVRQAVSTLSQYNDQIATDIQYIRFALATALQPIIETIIQLAYKLLSLIAFIAKGIFGVNIFANATADAFNRTKKEVGGTSKAVSKLQKQLAGFDEMNILQENGGTSPGGGGGGIGNIATPSFDLSNMETPDWTIVYSWTDKLKDIIGKTFDKIKKNVTKVMTDLGFSPAYIKAWQFTADGIEKILFGIVDTIGGILKIIVGLFSGNSDLVLDGVSQLGMGIVEIVVGVAQTVIGTFGMILIGLYDTLIKPIIQLVNETNNKISVIISNLVNKIIGSFSNAGRGIKNTFNEIVGYINTIIDKINGRFAEIGTKAGNVIGGAFKTVINAVIIWIESQLNKPIDTINNLISAISKVGINVSKITRIRLPRLAKGGVVNMPSKGVPIGGALAGEHGAEGVIPLTDSQQMALLGEAIGKYITVNANITNTMNGRVISRELQKISNESDFAYNR